MRIIVRHVLYTQISFSKHILQMFSDRHKLTKTFENLTLPYCFLLKNALV